MFYHGTQLYPSTVDLFTAKRIFDWERERERERERESLDDTEFNKTRWFWQVDLGCPTNDTCRVLLGMTYILFYAGSAKCSKKHLSKLLTYLLSVVKTWPQSCCDTRCRVIQMWILINSKDMFEYIQSRFLSSCSSIKTFDFCIFFIIIPHSKLSKLICVI